MKTIFLSIAILLTFNLFSQDIYSKVKIYTGSTGLQFLAEQGLPVDHGEYKKDISFTTILSNEDLLVLNQHGFFYDILIEDMHEYYRKRSKDEKNVAKNVNCPPNPNTFDPAVPSNFEVMSTYMGFYKYNEMLAELDQMFALYPNLITQKAPISTFETTEGRPIYHVKISDNPTVEESEPEVLYTAIHHAREPLSMSETIFFMWYLLENYATNDEVKFLVDHTEMYFVPCINVDGYIYNEVQNPNGGGMHRKNRRNVGTTNKGVDLNRNYSYGWGTTGTTTTNLNNDTYCGTGAFSEPETQAIKWLNENHNFVSTFNAHTYGNTLLHPVGTTTAEFADHHLYFTDLTQYMCSQNGFFPQKSSGLYPASGDSDDYQYKVDIGVGLKDTVFAMTPEVGSDFWPPVNEILPACKGMVLPNLMLSHMAHKYLVVKEDDPSIIADLNGTFHYTVQRLGLEDGTVSVTLVPLQNIQTLATGINYDLPVRGTDEANVAFTLVPTIQFGDEVKYVIETDYGLWVDRDTIIKTYGAISEQFVDNGNNVSNWTGNWSITTSTFYSAPSCFTDSPIGNYQNNANSNFTFNQDIDLTIATSAMISFYAKWAIETDYDYTQLQVSTDGGTTWIGQCGNYTVPGTSANGSVQPDGEPVWEGIQTSWVREEINLSDYLGETIKVRFKLRSDGGAREDGFYFDDFTLAYNVQDTSSGGLGLNEFNKHGITMYPNPSNGAFQLNGLQIGETILIVDANGKVIVRETIKNSTLQVDLKNNASGSYILKTTKNNMAVEQRCVILK